MLKKMDYKKSGVHTEKATAFVSWIKKTTSLNSFSKGSDFASLFPLPKTYKKPLIASCTDGVGTKVKLASEFEEWEGVGQDLVAMCLNDLICTGAKPLFFLDYYACGQLDPERAQKFLAGVHKACKASFCELVGGETAEMPGMYEGTDFDCAGFAVGLVEEEEILGAHRVEEGDQIVALSSSGFHSNGYSLLRKIYSTKEERQKNQKILMKPTRLYTFLSPHLKTLRVKAMAHITGGGLDNLLRILPDSVSAELRPWSVPAPFLEVKKKGLLSWNSLLKTLNCGLGFILIIPKNQKIPLNLLPSDCKPIPLGRVISSSEKKWNLEESQMDVLNKL